MNEDMIRDMIGAPTWQEEQEEQARIERNECLCGTINCSEAYSCTTSGY